MSSCENNSSLLHFMKILNTMRENGEFIDLTFELNDSKFSAHQLVMAVWSPPMKSLLRSQSTCAQRVRLAYDKPEVFRTFITFLYTGVMPQDDLNIPAVLHLAATFQIHLLTEICKEHLKAITTVDNTISMFHLAIKFRLTDLEKHCVEILCEHLAEVRQAQEHRDLTPTQEHRDLIPTQEQRDLTATQEQRDLTPTQEHQDLTPTQEHRDLNPTQEHRDLTPTQMNLLIKSEHWPKCKPELKLCLVTSWLAEDVRNREQFLVPLLGYIEWSIVDTDSLVQTLNANHFFTANPSLLYLLLQTLHSSSVSLGQYESSFWSLQQRYSNVLSSGFSNCAVLDSDKGNHFEPLSFSLVTSPIEEEPGQGRDAARIAALKNGRATDSDFSARCDTKYLEMKQGLVSMSLNIPVPRRNSSTRGSRNDISPERVSGQSTDGTIIPDETCVANIKSVTVEDSRTRKHLKPHKVTASTNTTKNSALNNQQSQQNTIISKQLINTRGRLRSSANVFNFASKKVSPQGSKTKEDTREILGKTKRTESFYNKNTKRPLSVVTGGETVLHGQQVKKQKIDLAEKDVKLIERQKSLQPTSSRSNTKSDGGYTNSDTRMKIKQVSSDRKILKKKDTEKQEHKCYKCEFTSYNKITLQKHQSQVHDGNCLFCCSLCSFKSKWRKEFYDHMKQSHFPGPPFLCDESECEYSTDKLQELVSHRKQDKDQRHFACDICLTAFRSKNNLYQHLKIHSDEKKFECPDCHRCFKLKNTLEQHVVTHNDLRPYLCDLCGFSTKFQSHLISHRRIHTGDVYRCNFPSCTYSTPKKSQLNPHMRSHLGIRRHICSTCGKAFVEKSHLIRHERTHSSEKAYTCGNCNHCFTRVDKLKEHIQKRHSQEVPRTKATTSASKKLENLEQGKTKSKTSNQCETEQLSLNQESHIEVVKSGAKQQGQSHFEVLETMLANIVTSSDVNASLVQAFPCFSLVAASSNHSFPIALTTEGATRSELDGADKVQREVSSAEAQGLHKTDVTTERVTAFEYQIQTITAEDSSLGNHAVVSCSSSAGGKAAGEIILQHFQESTSLTSSSYSLEEMDASAAHFSDASSHFEQSDYMSQQCHQVLDSPHHLIPQPISPPSTVGQQYYLSQQQQHLEQQHRDQQHLEQQHRDQQHLEQQHRDQPPHQETQQSEDLSNSGNPMYLDDTRNHIY